MKVLLLLFLLAHSAHGVGLKWETTTQRFEASPRERSVRGEFSYHNAGKTEIRIESVRGACVCCTAAHATKKQVPPGDGGVVVVKVDLEAKKLPLVKLVMVRTDDGQMTILTVEVVAAQPKRK
jgi:hypothetical protein